MDAFKESVRILCLLGTNEQFGFPDEIAYSKLKPFGDAGLAALQWAIKQENFHIKMLSLSVVQLYGPEGSYLLTAVIDCITSGDSSLRCSAIMAARSMRSLAKDALPFIEPFMDSDNFWESLNATGAVWSISEQQNKEAGDRLNDMSFDPKNGFFVPYYYRDDDQHFSDDRYILDDYLVIDGQVLVEDEWVGVENFLDETMKGYPCLDTYQS